MNLVLFSEPLFYDSEHIFEKKLDAKFNSEINENGPVYAKTNEELDTLINSLKFCFSSRHPYVHKYNNILGYVEFVLDMDEILIYYYFNGDKRKKYNRGISFRKTRSAIYPPIGYSKGAKIIDFSNENILNGLLVSIEKVELQCSDWKIYSNFEATKNKIRFIDFKGLLNLLNYQI